MGHRDSCDDLREVRWGVLGAGRISHRFASSLKEVDGARLVAAAGRTPSHVEEFCRAFSIDAARRMFASVAAGSIGVLYRWQKVGTRSCWLAS